MAITQGKSDLAQSKIGQMQQEFGQPMNWDSFQQLAQTPQGGAMPNVPNYNPENIQRGVSTEQLQRGLSTDGLQNVDPSQKYAKNAEDAIYGQWSGRQEPRMQQEQDRMRTQLYNSGLKEGDQAYNDAMQRLGQDQNDARTQAQYQATIGSGQEAQRMFGMDSSARQQQFGERQSQGAFANDAANQAFQQNMGAGQFGNSASAQALQQQLGIGSQQFNQQQANQQTGYNQQMQSAGYQNQLRQQQIAEQMQQRGFSLNEINAILNGQQVSMPNMPGFNSASASQAAQYNNAAQNQGQYNLDAFSAQQAGLNSALSGASSAAMMFSDRRLKKDVEALWEEPNGLTRYSFRYVWQADDEPKLYGFMADEVEKLYPEAVHLDKSGYKMVDYGRL
jgi:DNA-binding transcriptional MerR regulator